MWFISHFHLHFHYDYHIISSKQTYLLFSFFLSYHFWMITWIKNENIFQIAKVISLSVLLRIRLIFCRFQPGVAYKNVAYLKRCAGVLVITWEFANFSITLKINTKTLPNTYDGTFCNNSWWFLAINNFRNKLRNRCLTRFWHASEYDKCI